MSCSEKCFTRPKVRFSKSAESPEKHSLDGAFGKPKIRSITSIKPHVRILKAPLVSNEFQENSSPDEMLLRHSAGDTPNDANLCPVKSTPFSAPCLTEILLSPETGTSDVAPPSDKRIDGKTLSSPDLASKTLKSILVEKKSLSAKNVAILGQRDKKKLCVSDKCSKSLESIKHTEKNLPRTKTTGGKENIPSRETKKNVIVEVPNNIPRTSESRSKSTTSSNAPLLIGGKSSKSGVVGRFVAETAVGMSTEVKKNDTKPSSGIESTKIMEKKKAEASTTTKKLKSKTPTIGLMACMKHKKTENKIIPMKKTILRDASAKPTKVYVGPGLLRSKSAVFETDRKDDKPHRSRSEIHAGDKLACPEYNSIVCTMRKLRDARDKKVIGDPEHLPAIYRRLINGKVSSALDFGTNEAIYRDLVDLSIDEKQLPSRLTRSKDPEPRQRDVAPKLSDFFVPTNDEEYRRAVLIRPPSSRIIDTWNPYRISDRIFMWKESLDYDV